jgi:hypothetical protein
MAPHSDPSTMRAMESSIAQLHVDEESVEVFVAASETRQVVIATLDEQGRPTTVARWEPDHRRFDAPASYIQRGRRRSSGSSPG